MDEPRLTLIAYDSPSDRRRTRLAAALQSVGTRVQYSVFEAWLTRRQRSYLRAHLSRRLADDDHLRIYTLCETCRGQVDVHGGDPARPLPTAWIL